MPINPSFAAISVVVAVRRNGRVRTAAIAMPDCFPLSIATCMAKVRHVASRHRRHQRGDRVSLMMRGRAAMLAARRDAAV